MPSPLLHVVTSDGETREYSDAHVVGSLVLSGLDRQAAIERATTLRRIVEMSGRTSLSTDDIRFVIEELGNRPTGPRFDVIARRLTAPRLITPISAPVEVAPRELDPVTLPWRLADALSRLPGEGEDVGDVLRKSFTAAGQMASVVARTAPNQAGDVREGLDRLTKAMTLAGQATDKERFLRGVDAAVKTCGGLAEMYRTRPRIGASAPAFLTLGNHLASVTTRLVPDGFLPWDWAAMGLLSAVPPDLLLGLLGFDIYGDLPSNCPPCPEDCPVLGGTTYETATLTNPRNCVIKVSYLRLGFIVRRTCTWDASVRYKVVLGCYKSGWDSFWAQDACCISVWQWVEKQTRTHTQAIAVLPFIGHNDFPDTAETGGVGGKRDVPEGADKLR